MGQKQRIRTEIGKDHKITVELKQDFGLLEVLSLKLTQQDVYTSLCADYGVVCGRVSVNNGFGVPNARVSIFIPLKSEDEDDPVISALYPYKSYGDKDENGLRYNLFPARQQHSGHIPVGSFPDQMDVLTREEVLEVYESYYKYTVKTNDSGDFMIWGVPLGEQTIHVDLDVSDMGCFSLRPDDFLRKGYGIEDFKSEYEFKTSNDIDSLPQVVTFDKGIEVYPFWGNVDLCEIGITRVDFDLVDKGLKVEPSALIIGGSFADDGKNAINKNCVPHKNMSKKCSFTTQGGNIDAIRFSSYHDTNNLPVLEEYTITDKINDDGSFAFRVPMNRDFIYTTEFGENDYTNDPNKGIPTSSCYRFRFTLDNEGLERVRARASYLAPNIREYENYEDESYAWSLQFSGYPRNALELILNNVNGDYYPQDYFYRFQYGKVYTVSSFQSLIYDTPKRMLGINDIVPSEDKDCNGTATPFPTNMGIKNTSFNFQLLLSLVLTFLQYTFATIQLTVYEMMATFLYDFGHILKYDTLGIFKKAGETVMNAAFEMQASGQLTLPLTIYDFCDECSTDDTNLYEGIDLNDYCKIAELDLTITGDTSNTYIRLPLVSNIDERETPYTSRYNPGSARSSCAELTGCCESYQISTDGGYVPMNSMYITNQNGKTYPRFYIAIGGNSGATISSASFYVSGATLDFSQYKIEDLSSQFGSGAYGFIFDDAQIESLFGIQSGSTYFSSTPIISDLAGYIIDTNCYINPNRSYTGVTIEDECSMYDTLYDEGIAKSYLWMSGDTQYGNVNDPADSQLLNSPVPTFGIVESLTKPLGSEWSIGATVWYKDGQNRLPTYKDWEKISTKTYDRKTKTGYSEFRDGVFLIVPSRDGRCKENFQALREWYRRKLIGLYFCGGIVNYALVDNWLSGSLYFFQFKAKIKDKGNKEKVKACKTVVKFSADDERFYYRSCLFEPSISNPFEGKWGNDNGKGNDKYIGHPTTFVDLGPRDEFIKEICVDPTLDPNCSVSRSIGPTSFKSFGELVAFAVNYRMDVAGAQMVINDFFKNGGFYDTGAAGIAVPRVLNGDISQLISINSETGIDGFDMQNQKYLGYSISNLDPETMSNVFKNGNSGWGPTPVTLQYEKDGVRIRQCLNAPGFLTESSQKVPFYLWDKWGTGFGSYNSDFRDNQCWDYRTDIESRYLQGMSLNYRFTDYIPSGATDPDDPYLLPPISYDFSGQTVTGMTYTAEEFDEVIDATDTTIYPLDGSQDYDKVLKSYDSQYHGFKILLATSYASPMDPTAGRLYIRLGNQSINQIVNSGYSQPWLDDRWSLKIDWDETLAYSIWPSLDPYNNRVQILSTPFFFYFGLRPGKTGLDLLIKRFGPKGAFKLIE